MRYIFLSALMLFLASCSCRTTTVVLLPEEDGSVGQVEVTGDGGSQIIDKPNEYTVVESSTPEQTKEMSSEEISERFSTVIKAEALKPVSYLLYFHSDSSELMAKSEPIMKEIYSKIKERQPCDISVIGHSDRTGEREYNIKLSLKRATKIEKEIRALGLDIVNMDISSHGENDPLIKTADGVPEPRNRRVEVIVR